MIGLSAVALGLSVFVRVDTPAHISRDIHAPYLEVVDLFADIERYPELTAGGVSRGLIDSRETRDLGANRTEETVHYTIEAGSLTMTGKRVYLYDAEERTVVCNVHFYLPAIREESEVTWHFTERDGVTRVRAQGHRRTPALLSVFSALHSGRSQRLLDRISSTLEGR